MSTQENPLQETEFDSEQAITIQPSGIAPYAGAADWPANGETDPAQSGTLGLDTVLHSLRRHWLVMFTLGIAASAVVATAVWLALKPKYEAEAVLYLQPVQPTVLNHPVGDETERVADEFNIFRNTQAGLLKGRPVFVAALRNQKMKNLPSILYQDARHKTIPWLTLTIQVTQDKNSGLMRVTASLPDAKEAATIVNAVVGAYMDEVVNKDRDMAQRQAGQPEHGFRANGGSGPQTEGRLEARDGRHRRWRRTVGVGAQSDGGASLRGVPARISEDEI